MAVDYPLDLRTILIGRAKSQTNNYDATTPLSGPAYMRKLSTDAPAFYSVTFRFVSDIDCLVFRAWIEENDINSGAPFNLPIHVEGSIGASNEARKTQEVQVMPGTDILSNSHFFQGAYEYSAQLRCRKEVTGLESYYPLISTGGKFLLDGREQLDRAINVKAPSV